MEALPSHIWIMAEVRRCNDQGMPAYILQRGEKMGGLALVKVNCLNGKVRLFGQQRDFSSGELGWINLVSSELIEESDADSYIERSKARDPDLWVIEVEDRQGNLPFQGKRIAL